jgi:4,5-dihydroxyphthalate decarboxylase
MTANVWVRGMLAEEYGVKPTDIKWRRGGLEEPGREERSPIKLPPEIDLKVVPADRSLSDMLEKGELDGVIGARAPSCFLRGAPKVARLFPDYPAVEEAYFKKTRLFPIMHAIGIRRSLAEKYPWLAVNVYKAFLKAKALCVHELGQIGHLAATLPWPIAAYDHARKVMGEDFWPYGAHPNKHALETLARYSFEQGLSVRQVPLEEMFAKPTYELSKI